MTETSATVAVIEQAAPKELARDRQFSRLKQHAQSEVFTKFANVKSRISWTADHRQKLQEMWERGEKAPVIAAALGCKVGAVNVARARFGLKPRRIVSGRPKQEPDEPAHKVPRVAFTTSRLAEFCSEKELVAQTGHEARHWPRVIIKELVDNAIDAAEEIEVAPTIKVIITTGKRGRPNSHCGGGQRPRHLAGHHRQHHQLQRPGQLARSLRFPDPRSAGQCAQVHSADGLRARRQDQGRDLDRGARPQAPDPVHGQRDQAGADRQKCAQPSKVRIGTRVTVFWPDVYQAEVYGNEIADLLTQFVWVNPHLSLRFVIDGKTLLESSATNPDWTKYRACDATSAHWYNLEQFERYAGALIGRDQVNNTRRKVTVREFAAQFRGMSATEKQREIVRELGASHISLRCFFGSETAVKHQRMEKLLGLLLQHTRPVRPELLGVIGEDHLRQLCSSVGGELQSFKYFLSPGHDADGVPYLVEIGTCAYKKWVSGKEETRSRYLAVGVNFSATLSNPFQTLRGMAGMDEILTDLRAGSDAPVIVCVHYASPHIEYLDRGKSRIGLE